MKLLTDEEIAELRRSIAIADELHAPGPWQETTRLLDEVERSRALLKRIEWKASHPIDGDEYGETSAACPECGGEHPNHKPGCELAAPIGKTPA